MIFSTYLWLTKRSSICRKSLLIIHLLTLRSSPPSKTRRLTLPTLINLRSLFSPISSRTTSASYLKRICQKNPISPLYAIRAAVTSTAALLLCAISYINHWYKNTIRTHSHKELSSDYAVLVTRAGIEPTLTAWEAAVLTAWPTGHNKKEKPASTYFHRPFPANYLRHKWA